MLPRSRYRHIQSVAHSRRRMLLRHQSRILQPHPPPPLTPPLSNPPAAAPPPAELRPTPPAMRSDSSPVRSCVPPRPQVPSATFPSRGIRTRLARPDRVSLVPTQRQPFLPAVNRFAMCSSARNSRSSPDRSTAPEAHPVETCCFATDRKSLSVHSPDPLAQNRRGSVVRLVLVLSASSFHFRQKEIDFQLCIVRNPRRIGTPLLFRDRQNSRILPQRRHRPENSRSQIRNGRLAVIDHLCMRRIANLKQLHIHLRQHAPTIYSGSTASLARIPDRAFDSQHWTRTLRDQHLSPIHIKHTRLRLVETRLK